jgi:DNA adenine methylase
MSVIPLFSRVGSKSKIYNILARFFPKVIETFVEPFAGSGAAFFRTDPRKYTRGVLNDIDKMLMKANKYVKTYKGTEADIEKDFAILFYPSLSAEARLAKYNEIWNKLRKREKSLSPKEAFIYMLLAKLTFGSLTPDPTKKMKLYKTTNITKLLKTRLIKYRDRLIEKPLVLSSSDYKTVMKKYNQPKTFFFIDPPYENSEGLYSKDSAIDLEQLASLLKGVKGNFMLTLNDSPNIRKLFSGFKIRKLVVPGANTQETIGSAARKELIITNY